MDKVCCCCCPEPDLPDISVNVTCACCESHVEESNAKDSPDFTIEEQPKETGEEEEEEAEEDSVCCCFQRKRHANVKKRKT